MPDGILSHLYGPIEGSRHDSFILNESGLKDNLSTFLKDENHHFVIYGDQAYGTHEHIIAPYVNPAGNQIQFNSRMKIVREAIEWEFGLILSNWKFLDWRWSQQLFSSPIGKHYPVAAMLTNMKTCLEGNQISSFFGIDPPTIDEYMRSYG
jgi:hypothetical protein